MEPSNLDNRRDVHITENGFVTVNSTGFNFCLADINTCSSGFTFILNVKFHYLLDGTYILSSGGDLQNHTGRDIPKIRKPTTAFDRYDLW